MMCSRLFTAGLLRNIAIPFTINTIYSSSNRIVADAAWSSPDLNSDTGLVALEDAWVRSHGLLESQRFPWDDAKGLYVLNGFYNMHCLVGSSAPAGFCFCLLLLSISSGNPSSERTTACHRQCLAAT